MSTVLDAPPSFLHFTNTGRWIQRVTSPTTNSNIFDSDSALLLPDTISSTRFRIPRDDCGTVTCIFSVALFEGKSKQIPYSQFNWDSLLDRWPE